MLKIIYSQIKFLRLHIFGIDDLAFATIGSALIGAGSSEPANRQNEDLSNTSYQRQAVDLEKAGLNRILGYAKGLPVQNPTMQPVFKTSDLLNTAQAFKNLGETKRVDSEIEKNLTQAELNKVNAAVAEVEKALKTEQVTLTEQQVKKVIQEYSLLAQQIETEFHRTQQMSTTAAQAKVVLESKKIKLLADRVHEKLINTTGLSFAAVDRILSGLGAAGILSFWKKTIGLLKSKQTSSGQTYPF